LSKHYLDIPVVYYHSIGPVNHNWNRSFLTLDLPYFEDQLKFFKNNFQPVFLHEYWAIRNQKQPAGRNPLVITFDDGFLDNWIWAFPLLKKYGIKATIFVCPEFVDLKNPVRPNLDDYWNKNASLEEITRLGYMNWEEMRIMLKSGLIDIQSHTMSHTKYFISDTIKDFHHPGMDCLYPVGNLFPEYKPYHILNEQFEKLLPYGYPIFEEQSSVCARKVTINPDFIDLTLEALFGYDFKNYHTERAMAHIAQLYKKFKSANDLIVEVESEAAQFKRMQYEIVGSKKIIEENLNIPVEFLCWPHGDNNDKAHKVAMEAGYLATTSGSKLRQHDHPDRIPSRIGVHPVSNSRLLTLMKLKYKTGSAHNRFPYKHVNAFYNIVKYGKVNV
jgi:Polysaccharide deacetylase